MLYSAVNQSEFTVVLCHYGCLYSTVAGCSAHSGFADVTVIKNTDSTSNTFFGATSTEIEQSVTNTTTIISQEVEVKSKVQPLFEFYVVSIILGSFYWALFLFTG